MAKKRKMTEEELAVFLKKTEADILKRLDKQIKMPTKKGVRFKPTFYRGDKVSIDKIEFSNICYHQGNLCSYKDNRLFMEYYDSTKPKNKDGYTMKEVDITDIVINAKEGEAVRASYSDGYTFVYIGDTKFINKRGKTIDEGICIYLDTDWLSKIKKPKKIKRIK